jgi:hypothetical protein
MSASDFTDSPNLNDKFVAKLRVFKFGSSGWKLTKFQASDDGVIDAGGTEPVVKTLSLGVPSSNFSGLPSFDCGGV